MPWGSGAAAAAAEALAQGISIITADEAFKHNGRQYTIGTAFIRLAGNPEGAAATIQKIAQKHGAELVPITSTWTEEGISLGSGRTASLRAPRVLMAWDAPASSLSAGWARYTLEQRFGQKVTVMRTATLQNYDMKDYDVLVLPSGSYSFSDDALRRMKDWIRNGGTLITLAEATRWAARDNVGLLSTDPLYRDGSPQKDAPAGGAAGGRRRERRRFRAEAGHDQAVRLREGDPAGAGAAGESRRLDAARHAVSVSLAVGRTRRRRPGDRRRHARVRAAQARCRCERRGLRRRRTSCSPAGMCGRKRCRCSRRAPT